MFTQTTRDTTNQSDTETDEDTCAVCDAPRSEFTTEIVMAIGELTLGDVNLDRRRADLDEFCSLDCFHEHPDPLPDTISS
ncbi:hypothetical protein [Salinibaculum rarum]|uniref:hypothetical protein n=1 Tax=Salinibaculum rarum TaxID=3058903 RepID=UPI00265DC5F0|nr:hypothetical protein [Salinibaculum sp. KK48]